MWPKFEDKTVGMKLASIGSVNDQVINLVQLAGESIILIEKLYPGRLSEKYNAPEDAEPSEIIHCAGVRNGLILKGGEVDVQRASELVLSDLRSGRLGKITLEEPKFK